MADDLPPSNNTSPSMEIQVSDDHCIEQVEKIKQELDVIKEDVILKLQERDANFIAGVSTFIKTYKSMQQSSHAPTASVAHALHTFGKSDSKLVLNTIL